MADAFGIGTSALNALQQAIKTTGQNIANVNTEGYSRQQVDFATRTPESQGGYYIGTGTEISAVSRAYDQFLQGDFQRRTSSSTFYESLAVAAGRVDELFASDATGIGPALNDFFNSLEAVANSPTTLPERQVMLSQAETLAQRFSYFDLRLSEFQDQLNIKIRTSAEDVNQYAEVIAELNSQISLQSAQTGGNPSPDLLDKRDQAVTELSALIATTTQFQDDGSVNVFIGRGQPLVIGADASALAVQPDTLQPKRLSIFVVSGDRQGIEITSLLNGGEIGAALTAYDDVIDQARREIGVLAAGLTITFNQVHSEGYGLKSTDNGLDFFNAAAGQPSDPRPLVGNTGTATLTASIDDPLNPFDDDRVAQLTGDSYRVAYTAGTESFSILNLTTGQTVLPETDSLRFLGFSSAQVSGLANPPVSAVTGPQALTFEIDGLKTSVPVANAASAADIAASVNAQVTGVTARASTTAILDLSGTLNAGEQLLLNINGLSVSASAGLAAQSSSEAAGNLAAAIQSRIDNGDLSPNLSVSVSGGAITLTDDTGADITLANFSATGASTAAAAVSARDASGSAIPGSVALTATAGTVVTGDVVFGADNATKSYALYNEGAANTTLTTATDSVSGDGTAYDIIFDGVTLKIDDPSLLAGGDSWFFAPTANAAASFGVAIDDPAAIAAASAANSPGDSSNMQKLIGLQDEATLLNGASYNDYYTNITSKIAVQTRRANSLAETEASLLASADTRRSNLAGVNLEEEAANLIRFQQAFQAAAQVIATARDVFDVLIRATE